jgi:NADH-quinone oxidoreductase subunit A
VFTAWVQSGRAVFAYAELAAFLVILIVGLAYVWRKGDLDWLKRLDHDIEVIEAKREHGIPSDKH